MDRKAIYTGLALLGIVVLAAGFRFYELKNYPPGLFPDQAANGLDALNILKGDVRPFYPSNNGREGLFFFLQALNIKLFGIGIWQMFAASALVGVATVAATFWATRVFFGRLAGLLAALFLATSAWHVTLSRTGFRAIMIPLFVALFTGAAGATIRAVRQKKVTQSYVLAVFAGVMFSLGFYTYIAYRIMVGVLLGMLLLWLIAALHPKIGFPQLKRYRTHMLLAFLAAAIVVTPLVVYFAFHPAEFIGRAGQVSVFNPDLQRQYGGGKLLPTIFYSLRESIYGLYAGTGDLNWRHSVAGYPLLNPLVGIVSLLGLAWVINGTITVFYIMRKGKEVHQQYVLPYLLLLLCGMLMPVITTAEGIPHGLRSVGLIIPLFMMAGVAASVCVYWLKLHVPNVWRSAVYGVAAGLLVLGAAYDGALYFLIARNSAGAYEAYRGDLTVVAEYINMYARNTPDAPRPYVALDEFSLMTVRFLTGEAEQPYRAIAPAQSHLTFLQPGEIIIFAQADMVHADRYVSLHPEAVLVSTQRNRWHEEILRVYQVPVATPVPEKDSLDA